MQKYSSALCRLDTPLTPQMKGERADINFFTICPGEDIQKNGWSFIYQLKRH